MGAGPAGAGRQATTYGLLAEAHFGVAKGQGVGQAMARCPGDVPWWRVVHADGRMKGAIGGRRAAGPAGRGGVPLTPAAGRLGGVGGPWSLTPEHGSRPQRPVGKPTFPAGPWYGRRWRC